MSCDASDRRQTEVGDACSPVLVDQYVCLRRCSGRQYEDIQFGRSKTHSFQISMYHEKVVHVLYATCNAGQLNNQPSVLLLRDQVTTYKLDAIYVLVPLNKLVDVPVLHPLGNESEPVFI